MGGYSILSLGSKNVDTIHDVTGIAWATPNMLVYSVSPIYGKPGIYIYDCIGQASRQIVAPKNMNNAYPDGADYFELYGMDGSKILFYYTNDVDSLDFSEFRNRSLLFGVNLDGSNFVRFKNND
jgi:hypothetical protein